MQRDRLIKSIMFLPGHNIKWDRFEILASGKIEETLFIQELQPSLNVSVGSEGLLLY